MLAGSMALPLPPDPATPPAQDTGYRWFAGGVASWFGAWGMQQVMFSWLVVGELRASPEWVGIAQTSTMLPAIALLLVGGAAADRLDARRLLATLHLAAALPVVALAGAVAAGLLSVGGLIAYGVAMGVVMAFSNPARDSLLSRVAGGDVMRAVTGATIVQFGAQGVGTLLAGAARWVGSPITLLVQAGVIAAGALATRRLPSVPIEPRAHGTSAVREVTEGLRFVLGTPGLRVVLVCLCGVGLLFMGPFLVVFPLVVRDVYGGDVDRLSLVLMLFPLGTIAGSGVILLRGGIRRKGRALLAALACGGLALIVAGQDLPFPGFLAVTLAWGLAGSVFMNCSRTLFQEAAPPERRARVLSVNQLGFMATGPLGSLLAGFVSGLVGPLPTLVLFGAGMLLLVSVVALSSTVPRLE
jgi:MFS family permease